MIDIGLSKLMIVGVVALIVIGPEKLPRVARTAGALFGRAQRYVNDVKTEVSQQMAMEDIQKMKNSVEEAARTAQASVSKTISETNQSVESAWKGDGAKPSIEPSSAGLLQGEDGAMLPSPSGTTQLASPADGLGVSASAEPFKSSPPPKGTLSNMSLKDAPTPTFIQTPPVSLMQAHAQAKLSPLEAYAQRSNESNGGAKGVRAGHRSWMAQRTATPLWYKRRTRTKGALLSSAARHSRQTP